MDNLAMQNGAFMAMFAGLFVAIVAFGIISYIYLAITMMITAKRLKTKDAWMAWVPVLNLVLMARMAKMHWWPVLLLLVSFIPILGQLASIAFLIYTIIWQWKICEARKRPGWWALLIFIPFWQFIMWGILAWGKK